MENILNFLDGLIDGSTPEHPKWNIESVQDGKPPHWNYIDGCMLKAVLDIYAATKKDKYLAFADGYVDYFVNDNGSIKGYNHNDFNCDNINEGKALFTLYSLTGKEKYRKAIETLMAQLLEQPLTPEGNFWHKKIYPNQIWLDGLYMVQPFWLAYDMMFNGKKDYQFSIKQFNNVWRLMRDEKTGLLFHGYDSMRENKWCDKESGCSKNFWTRSLGWFAMALVDSIEILDEQFFDERQMLVGYLKSLLDTLLVFRDGKSKLLWQVPNYPAAEGNYLETSGSCAVAYCFMKGARLGVLPVYYFDYGQEMLESVYKLKFAYENGEYKLSDICLVAGLGGMPGRGYYKERDGTVEYYLSEPRVDNDAKGVAPFLFGYAELLRRVKP